MPTVFLIRGDHDDELILEDELEILANIDASAAYLIKVPYDVYREYVKFVEMKRWWDSCLLELSAHFKVV